jgi:AraC family L-rhamnose operon transcriptional activator RhaR
MDAVSGGAQFTDLNLLSLSLQCGSFTCELLYWGFYVPRWWRNYLHVHSFFEVCYVYQGRGMFRIADQTWQVQAGDIFVARPGEAHEIISSHDDPLGIYFWAYTLLPDEKSSNERPGVDILMSTFLTSQQAVSARTPSMLRTLELLTEEVVRKEPGYLQAIEALVIKLLLDTARAVVDLPRLLVPIDPPAKHSDEAIVQVMVRYLRDNYSRCTLSVCDLAAQVHLSERHASRLFHQVMGTTIKAYLTTLRIEKAMQLLLEGCTPIKEVALAIGYPDVRYFTTLFRQRVGLPPASFQRKGGTRFLNDRS